MPVRIAYPGNTPGGIANKWSVVRENDGTLTVEEYEDDRRRGQPIWSSSGIIRPESVLRAALIRIYSTYPGGNPPWVELPANLGI